MSDWDSRQLWPMLWNISTARSSAWTVPVGEFLNLSSQRRGPFLRTNVLVQAEEVIRIVM